jgi:hypothetical protein
MVALEVASRGAEMEPQTVLALWMGSKMADLMGSQTGLQKAARTGARKDSPKLVQMDLWMVLQKAAPMVRQMVRQKGHLMVSQMGLQMELPKVAPMVPWTGPKRADLMGSQMELRKAAQMGVRKDCLKFVLKGQWMELQIAAQTEFQKELPMVLRVAAGKEVQKDYRKARPMGQLKVHLKGRQTVSRTENRMAFGKESLMGDRMIPSRDFQNQSTYA